MFRRRERRIPDQTLRRQSARARSFVSCIHKSSLSEMDSIKFGLLSLILPRIPAAFNAEMSRKHRFLLQMGSKSRYTESKEKIKVNRGIESALDRKAMILKAGRGSK